MYLTRKLGGSNASDEQLLTSENYRVSLPEPEVVLLLIEVSDTTLAYDRRVKLPLYARAGIREVWILNLPNEAIEVYTKPSANGYRRVEHKHRGQTLESIAMPGPVPSVDEVLG